MKLFIPSKLCFYVFFFLIILIDFIQLSHCANAASDKLMGFVELKGPLRNVPQWIRVIDVEKKTPGLVASRKLLQGTQWETLKAEWAQLPLRQQLQQVNNYFNRWPYKTDRTVYKVEDYWAAPVEFLKNSGDCEDYAITKYFALRQLGVPAAQMRIVAVFNKLRNEGHAILAVYDADDIILLDNMSNLIISHTKASHYTPVFSVNEENRWAHLPPRNK